MIEQNFMEKLLDGAKVEWKPLGEVALITIGEFVHKNNQITLGKYPVYNGGKEPTGYYDKYNNIGNRIIVSARGANAGYVRLYYTQVWSADSCFIDNSIYPYIYYCYIFLKSNQKNIFDSQEGSAQPHIYPRHIMDLNILIGNEDLVEYFEKTVSPIFEKIKYNSLQIQTLTQTRDSLLPRLMSGKIKV